MLKSYNPGSPELIKYIEMNGIKGAFIHKEDEREYQVLVGSPRKQIGFVEGTFATRRDALALSVELNELIKSADLTKPMVQILDAIKLKANLSDFTDNPAKLTGYLRELGVDGDLYMAANRLLTPMTFESAIDAYEDILDANPGKALQIGNATVAFIDANGYLAAANVVGGNRIDYDSAYDIYSGGFVDGHWADHSIEEHWRNLLQPPLIEMPAQNHTAKATAAAGPRMG